MGDSHEFKVTAREGEDVVTLRRIEMLALLGLIDGAPRNKVLQSARSKIANKIPKRMRPPSPGE